MYINIPIYIDVSNLGSQGSTLCWDQIVFNLEGICLDFLDIGLHWNRISLNKSNVQKFLSKIKIPNLQWNRPKRRLWVLSYSCLSFIFPMSKTDLDTQNLTLLVQLKETSSSFWKMCLQCNYNVVIASKLIQINT